MHDKTSSLVQTILGLPIFQTEWVLYLLLALSVISIGVMLERWFFYRTRSIDVDGIRDALSKSLEKGDFEAAAALLGSTTRLKQMSYWWASRPIRRARNPSRI